jgi:hypothetical protein
MNVRMKVHEREARRLITLLLSGNISEEIP